MLRFVLDGISMLLVLCVMYFLLIFGDIWDNKVRCDRGYEPACRALSMD